MLAAMAIKNANSNIPLNPYIVLIGGIIGVSTGAIFARLADAPALVTAAYRVGLAALILVPLAGWKARDELRLLSSRDIKLAMLAGLFLAMHFASWISSLDYTAIANSVVLVNTIPLWVGLLTPLVTGDRIQKPTVISIGLSVFGAAVIGFGDFAIGGQALWGDFLALVGAFSAAIYLLLGRNLRRKLSLLSYVAVCYGSAAVILWLAVLLLKLPISGYSSQTVAAFWAMALISQILGHSSYNWALKWFSTGFVAVALLGEPIGSTFLAYILFDEGLTWLKLMGGLFILSAIYIAAAGEHS
ncbi:Permease of the drug/metabolite transporter (DMT) superfamily [Olavius sp. associated proteobacterium Delta 1]|nr:Permease of the drug/metabolite transporter (DMT) superfamily [Olavius sp. associated proteobacterium Delta 1]